MSSSSKSSPYLQTHRLKFLVEYGSSLSALRRKLKDKNPEKIREMDHMNTVEDIKRLKEELKVAKQSLVPPSYSLDLRGGDKVIKKLKGIVNDLIAVDNHNEGRYKELIEELDEMKEDHRLNRESQKQASGGLSSSSQVVPFDEVNNYEFQKVFEELSHKTRVRLLLCSPLAKMCTRGEEVYNKFVIWQNLEISEGLCVNWLIGTQIVDDVSEGEQFLAELVAEPSFNLIRAYNSSKIIVSPDFARSLASLKPDIDLFHSKYANSALLINLNSTCNYKLNVDQVTVMPIIHPWSEVEPRYLGIIHLGNFYHDMGHVVVEDTFLNDFDKLLKANKDHIRFLSLQGISRIQELPPSDCELSQLRVLDLRSCQDLKSLPNDIGRLIKLVCLDLCECYQLDHIPKGIALLTNLRVLLGFIIVTDNLQQPKELMHRFAEFDNLNHLTRLIKLTIRTRRMSFPTNDDLQTLNSMQELRKLKAAWVKSFVVESCYLDEILQEGG